MGLDRLKRGLLIQFKCYVDQLTGSSGFMHIDLEPDWRTAMPSCGPRFSELTDRQFADLYGESFQAKTARLENIDAGRGTASQLPQKASRGTHPPKRCFRGCFKRTQRRTVKAVDKTV